MPGSSGLATVALFLFAGLVLASAVLVVWLRNIFRAALSLGLVLIGIAGLFILLEAEFLAFVQILVYVGAILTLVVFAVMLTARVSDAPPKVVPVGGAAIVSLALFLLLASVVQVLTSSMTPVADAVTLPQLGRELVTTLVLPFEVISVLFVAAMVGAIAVAASKLPASRSPTVSRDAA